MSKSTFGFSWNQVPFVRFVIPLLSGILTARTVPYDITNYLIYLLLSSFVFTLFIESSGIGKKYKWRWLFGIPLNIFLFMSGVLLMNVQQINLHQESMSSNIIGIVDSDVDKKNEKYKTIIQLLSEAPNPGFHNKKIRANVIIAEDSVSSSLQFGDVICFNSKKLEEPKGPQNPDEFDYRKYLKNHSICYQVYLMNNEWQKIESDKGNRIFALAISLRKSLMNIMRSSGLIGEEHAVLSALLLGYTEEIERDLNNSYASAGANHILSVSGLHVGIVFILINWLLSFIGRKKWANITRTLILIISLWFYALLTGLSPAVLRAALMLSCVVIGNALNKMTNIYNTLAISVFILVFINPSILYEVGFQLSYLAVLGIVTFHPSIYQWYYSSSKIKDSIWSIISVSLAAQLSTFPLALFYFHQFPVYFLLTNILVIPLSTIIIYGGIILLVTSPIIFINIYIGKLIIFLVWLLNFIIRFVEKIPYSLFKGIAFSELETIILYGLIMMLFVFLMSRKKQFFFSALIICMMLCGVQTYRALVIRSQKCLVIYSIKNCSVMCVISGTQSMLLADSLFFSNTSSQQFHINNFSIQRGFNSMKEFISRKKRLDNTEVISHTASLCRYGNLIAIGSKSILLVDKNFHLKKQNRKNIIPIDYLVLAKNQKLEIGDLIRSFHPGKIIFDSSNSIKMIRKWSAECKRFRMPYYSVPEQGAYVEELSNV